MEWALAQKINWAILKFLLFLYILWLNGPVFIFCGAHPVLDS